MIIRKANKYDINKIHSFGMEVKEFKVDYSTQFWSKQDLERWFKSSKDVTLVAIEGDDIIGFILFEYCKVLKKANLSNVWVSSKFRGRGIAKQLYCEGIQQLKTKGATYIISLVEENAKESKAFHRKNKFRKGNKFIWFYKKI